jgi:Ca-activated chloride channel homolog
MTRAMRQLWMISLLVFSVVAEAVRGGSQTTAAAAQGAAAYRLNVSVDEVVLTFHAADAHSLPVDDLKLDELTLQDSGRPPRKILAFQLLQNFPIRAGILMDTSESMMQTRSRDRAIAMSYAQQVLRRQTDRAFVIDFDRFPKLAQPWTNEAGALAEGIRNYTAYGGSHLQGTAIFDAIYEACLNQFGHIDNTASGNFILLFSDGEDNASHASLKLAVDMCQRANTAIYPFRAGNPSGFSEGPRVLAELASETGGRVFHDDESDPAVYDDLRIIEADLRNQYRLIYKPPEMKHDGSFRRIVLQAPERVDSITIRSGYYAPTH